jgi:hypothetical protein
LKALPRLMCTCLFFRVEAASVSCDLSDDFSVSEIILPQTFSNRIYIDIDGARGGVVVKALRYKPAGRRIDSRWCYWIFSVT